RDVLRRSGGAALVGALAGIHGLGGPAFSEEEWAGGPAIDTHIHVVPSELPGIKPKPKDVETLYGGPLSEMAARVRVEMHLAKFQVAFGIGCLGGPPADPLGIAGTLALAASVPGLRAVGVADPRRIEPAHLKAVEAQIEANRGKIVAFKAYLGYLHFGPE